MLEVVGKRMVLANPSHLFAVEKTAAVGVDRINVKVSGVQVSRTVSAQVVVMGTERAKVLL